jgi:2-iminobutanoate/2-iminopropanoate deaminase
MSVHTAIQTAAAPAAVGPYSQARLADGWLFVSGQLPIDPATGTMVSGSIADRAEQIFHNIEAIVAAAGGRVEDIVKITLFLTDLSDFGQVNEAYARFFQEPYPARSTIGVAALPLGSNIEAEAVAWVAPTTDQEAP